jgi:D-glycero-alpha-D-manno-heptose-7-phosphate kinase
VRLITATAPIRICDVGGWTDTWFAGHGRVLNLAVTPVVRVEVRAAAAAGDVAGVTVEATALARRYTVRPGEMAEEGVPIVDAALRRLPPPAGLACGIRIGCAVPPGASTGTSAALAVATLGALARLRGTTLAPAEAAELAFDLEARALGRESGVQDQIAAAFGGINSIAITAFPDRRAFPRLTVSPIDVPRSARDELERRLVLLYLGQGHESSAVHRAVIARLSGAGPDAPALARCRALAADAAAALAAGDLERFGAALVTNTETQRELHPMLVSAQVDRLIAVAARHGAAGWKVNGAGGEGGTVSVLAGSVAARPALVRALLGSDARLVEIPIALATPGLEVQDRPADAAAV